MFTALCVRQQARQGLLALCSKSRPFLLYCRPLCSLFSKMDEFSRPAIDDIVHYFSDKVDKNKWKKQKVCCIIGIFSFLCMWNILIFPTWYGAKIHTNHMENYGLNLVLIFESFLCFACELFEILRHDIARKFKLAPWKLKKFTIRVS